MTSQSNKDGTQLRSDFDKICETLYDLADRDECDVSFEDGRMVSESDCAMMRISYDDSVRKACWKPFAKEAKLEKALEDHEEMIEDIERGTERALTKTMADAYLLSIDYCDFLWFCLWRAALHNPALGGTEGLSRFEQIR